MPQSRFRRGPSNAGLAVCQRPAVTDGRLPNGRAPDQPFSSLYCIIIDHLLHICNFWGSCLRFGNWLWFFLRRLSSLFSLKSSPEVKTTHIDPLSLFINSPSVVEFLQFSKLNLFIGNDRVCAFKCSKAWLLRWNNTLIEWTFICWMALKDFHQKCFQGAPK